jgi:hypothetical protein
MGIIRSFTDFFNLTPLKIMDQSDVEEITDHILDLLDNIFISMDINREKIKYNVVLKDPKNIEASLSFTEQSDFDMTLKSKDIKDTLQNLRTQYRVFSTVEHLDILKKQLNNKAGFEEKYSISQTYNKLKNGKTIYFYITLV